MGQSLGTRIEVRGTLTCLGPVHVGGWDTTALADLSIARDGTDRPFLPGSSIAGALRAYLASVDRFGGDRSGGEGPTAPLDALFGYVTPYSHSGSPSWIRIDDAPLTGETVTPAVRDGVGIDRRSASAAAAYLYTREVLPAGTAFALRLVADTPTTAPEPGYPGGWPALVHDAVETVIAGLSHGRVPIGAGRGRGHGRVQLRDVTVRHADLSEPAGLVAWLTGTAEPTRPLVPELPPQDGRLRITVAWRPTTPVLVRDSLSGTVVDTLPLTATDVDGTVRLLLPGSSIRGVVRSHAERIMRTLLQQDAPDHADGDSFGETLRRPPVGVDVLFGAAPDGHRQGRPGSQDTTGWRGAVSVADCHSLGQLSAQSWNSVVTVSPKARAATARTTPGTEPRQERADRNSDRDQARTRLYGLLGDISPEVPFQISDHVAIDRWTGGASDHRLFSVLEPGPTVRWEPIRIEVDVARLARFARLDRSDPRHASATAALPLLLLVLRDLRDGWLTLGYGSTRGRGQIEVTDVTFEGAGLVGAWQSLAGRTLDAILADPPTDIVDAMARWENQFQENPA
ncbi:CRISPR/Cas system CSM-associated protein Csm3 (group 7 of RAMP superfamily) [Micromonospora sp. Llam0]|uniref:RAMP superfamily CRISPR-associated protein n=1 Tax=Micromonospora sp. Llam0 TaxID=2485143 RepID=UPI000F49EED4|nr:RAMP superfamily CRISPR-associated protein [Micromonospora sp. Llam0]ROO60908.1 CRISPR/Cas system CSM-associated protein Csm3 (group 7 of RAMP superfamily) [Micromonospora sp. Llam0]